MSPDVERARDLRRRIRSAWKAVRPPDRGAVVDNYPPDSDDVRQYYEGRLWEDVDFDDPQSLIGNPLIYLTDRALGYFVAAFMVRSLSIDSHVEMGLLVFADDAVSHFASFMYANESIARLRELSAEQRRLAVETLSFIREFAEFYCVDPIIDEIDDGIERWRQFSSL